MYHQFTFLNYPTNMSDSSAKRTVQHPHAGIPVEFATDISENAFNKVVESFYEGVSKFNNWLYQCLEDKSVSITSIRIDSVTMFGPKLIGFIYLTANMTRNGKPLPGVVFIRGDAVACLVIVKTPSISGFSANYHMVLVDEFKAPTGKVITQTPAGMLNNGTIKGAMMAEIEEETGIVVSSEVVIPLSECEKNALPIGKLIDLESSFYPSQGGCDEKIHCYAYIVEMSSKKLNELHGRQTGRADENENITVRVVSLSNSSIRETQDSKLIVCASALKDAGYTFYFSN